MGFEVKLKDLTLKIGSGSTPRGGKGVYLDEGEISLIRSQNIYNHYFEPKGLAYISEEQAHKLRIVDVQKNDILINITGDSVARSMVITSEYLPARVNQHVSIIRCNTSKLDPYYLSAWLTSDTTQKYLLSIGQTGGTRAALTKKMLEEIHIPLLEIKKQKAIGSMLKVINDKIHINNMIISKLEQLAQTLFKRWFVDFEFPDGNGEPYKSSGGKMTESELGEMPEEWAVKPLLDLCDIVDCLHSKKPEKVNEPTEHLLLQVTNILNNGLVDLKDKYFIKKEDYKKWTSKLELKKGDCVLTNVGRVGAPAQIPYYIRCAIGRNMTALRIKDRITPTFLINYLLSEEMTKEIYHRTDSGTILNSLNVRGIKKLRVVVPCGNVIQKTNHVFKSVRDQMEYLHYSNGKLIELRDTLLPKLLSGEIELPEDREVLEHVSIP